MPEKSTLLDAVPKRTPVPMVVSDEQPLNALLKLFPLLKSNAGKLVSPLDCHAAVKFTFVAAVPSFAPAGNDVRAVQSRHALVKLTQLLMSISPNELSDAHKYHA